MSVTQRVSGASGSNCRWSLLGDTILVSPVRARGLQYPVSDLSLYPDTFHLSPDSVGSALLSAVTQIQMDLAITIDVSRFQPELFNLPCQSQICLMALRMRLLKPGVKATGMYIRYPTEQADRPATVVVTDKSVPLLDSFAKYAVAFLICPVRR